MTALVRWDPWEELAAFERQIERLFRDTFGSLERLAPVLPARPREWIPACDVFTRGEDLVARFELPGVDPEKELEITVEDGTLCVRGERRFEEEEKGEGYLRREVARGSFERAISLPEGVKPEDITATYQDGILEVVVPKAAVLPERKKIPVKVAGERRKAIRGRKVA